MNIRQLISINMLVATMALVASCGGGGSGSGEGNEPTNGNVDSSSGGGENPTDTNNPQVQLGKLIRSNETDLSTYFQDSIKRVNTVKDGNGQSFPEAIPVLASSDATFSPGAASSTNSSAGATGTSGGILSSTNIQERGVDEADLIKTNANGRYIYSVKKPSFNLIRPDIALALEQTDSLPNDGNPTRNSDVIRIMDTQGEQGITEIKRLASGNDTSWNISGLYLHDTKKRLIALASANQNFYTNWFNSFYFAAQETEVLLIDVNDPANAAVENRLHFDGQLIDSRRNGDTLYMVLRHYPNYQYVDDIKLATTTSDDFLPRYQINEGNKQLISKPEDCYVEAGKDSKSGDQEDGQNIRAPSDIITLVAVDLASETPTINSQCYVGSAEAIYASQNALYLATTRWDYRVANGIASYNSTITTDIHKFAYDGLDFDYRGSGEVNGHLGFKQDSKSFRFSEHEGVLRVITFDEDQWATILPTVEPAILPETEQPSDNPIPVEPDGGIGDGAGPIPGTPDQPIEAPIPVELNDGIGNTNSATSPAPTLVSQTSPVAPQTQSPVSLTILKEDPDKKALQVISKLPNANRPAPIGLPREQLYATRFVGNRGYVVTFRITDPLYVLDLSNPADPFIAGELKIDGYSDYIHPVSDNLILGVGKDAIPATSNGFGDGRGAWYQGVKLSLIDVTDPSNPREADKVVIGKRGTESTVLQDHHGFTGVRVDDKYRIALPIELHTNSKELPDGGSDNKALPPNLFYGYTETGLYRYEIDINSQQIVKVPAMIVENSNSTNSKRSFQLHNDRSVFINNEVYYMHDGDFWSQDWHGNNPLIGSK